MVEDRVPGRPALQHRRSLGLASRSRSPAVASSRQHRCAPIGVCQQGGGQATCLKYRHKYRYRGVVDTNNNGIGVSARVTFAAICRMTSQLTAGNSPAWCLSRYSISLLIPFPVFSSSSVPVCDEKQRRNLANRIQTN